MDKGNGCSRKSKKYFRPQTDQLGFHSSAGFTLQHRRARNPRMPIANRGSSCQDLQNHKPICLDGI